jgi:glucose dehydrogenase
VHKLQLAWKFDAPEEGGLESSPIMVGRLLYGYTATQKVIALDAASGKLIWEFQSGIKGQYPIRGVSYWTDGKESRIFASVTNFLYALDAQTGKSMPDFGESGRIDLRCMTRNFVSSIALPASRFGKLSSRIPRSRRLPPTSSMASSMSSSAPVGGKIRRGRRGQRI